MWTALSENSEILTPNSTVSIENSVTSDSRSFYFVSNLTITHINTRSEIITRKCLATVTVNGLETESASSAQAHVNVKGTVLYLGAYGTIIAQNVMYTLYVRTYVPLDLFGCPIIHS